MTPGLETTPTSSRLEVPCANRSMRLMNVVTLHPHYRHGLDLKPEQLLVLRHFKDLQSRNFLLPGTVPNYENPTITPHGKIVNGLPEKVSFGGTEASIELTGQELASVLDAIFGGDVTDKD